MELEERWERRQRAIFKRHAALMREFDRHARIEEECLPKACEVKAALAAMVAAGRLVERFERERARINGQVAKLLEELRPVLRITEARERARLVASFSFWLEKMKRRANGHATDDGNRTGSGSPQEDRGAEHAEARS
jgi:hypothetical protein